jgi:hypothetical protein
MSNGSGRLSNGGTSVAIQVVHRVLWLMSTVGAIASFIIAIKGFGTGTGAATNVAICAALAPYVAARSWDELFKGDEPA